MNDTATAMNDNNLADHDDHHQVPLIQPIASSAIQRIVARHVVTDLSSHVKELVDNAIDAGAVRVCEELACTLFCDSNSNSMFSFLWASSSLWLYTYWRQCSMLVTCCLVELLACCKNETPFILSILITLSITIPPPLHSKTVQPRTGRH